MRAKVVLDDVDVTNLALEGSSTRRLNRPSEASVKLPMQDAFGGAGSLLRVYFDGVLHFHGRVLLCETDASEDTGYTVYNATDPLELWKWRPVRDSTGNFSLPGYVGPPPVSGPLAVLGNLDGLNGTLDGPSMISAIFDNSINAGAGPPADAEGPLFLQKGTINVGTTDVTGAPQDWPMTMADFATLLVGTGETDIVITPIELDVNGNMGRLDVYPGNYGFDMTSQVAFQYGFGQRNVRALRWNEDMTNITNKLWTYLGQKLDEEHWPSNITGTAGDPFWAACGADSSEQAQWIAWHNEVVACAGTGIGSPGDSRGDFGVRMDIKVFDAQGSETVGFCFNKKLWLEESFLRCRPQTLVHVTPIRGLTIGEFDIGDLVLVEASSEVRGGFSGVQRVYEYTVSWDKDSVLTLSELQVSADGEGF